ncbi:MAG: 4-hydroxythreonine-4-phosphate dehydrogenase PdxA [Flavobacteriaceae bacterium]|nr:4-hydroxythreonine-4-phosphate dehydrogenase PdxA [Flavobacteriaceae bacterium]
MPPKPKKILVGISMGNPNGIGPEIIIKTFEDKRMYDFFTVIVFGSSQILQKMARFYKSSTKIRSIGEDNKVLNNTLNVLEVAENQEFDWQLGQSNAESGRMAVLALEEATHVLNNDKIHCLVTAPIDKQSSYSEDFPYAGHTEYLKDFFNQETLMMMVSEHLRVALVTEHIALSEIPRLITKERLHQKLDLLLNSLKQDFGIHRPKVAVLGLNPHSGDNGVMGSEEIDTISPIIKKYRNNEEFVFGPFSADGFFASGKYRQFDATLAMFHDQGLIPFKALSFGNGVNFTAGLDKVRTSPDHGTAFDIAGKNKANANSFREALFTGRQVYYNRLDYLSTESNSD